MPGNSAVEALPQRHIQRDPPDAEQVHDTARVESLACLDREAARALAGHDRRRHHRGCDAVDLRLVRREIVADDLVEEHDLQAACERCLDVGNEPGSIERYQDDAVVLTAGDGVLQLGGLQLGVELGVELDQLDVVLVREPLHLAD